MERTAHERSKLRIIELEAKLARREEEMERLFGVGPSDETLNVNRNRMLEAEIAELKAKVRFSHALI